MAARPAAPAIATLDLVLASASPRRLDLLRQAGLEPAEVRPAEIDEAAGKAELPRDYARRVAWEKLDAVWRDLGGRRAVLAADTVVACGRRILPKTETEAEARACLELLSGRRHHVLGAVVARAADGRTAERLVDTAVALKRLEAREIDAYLASGEWHGKAGGYAIQGRAGAFVRQIVGSYTNVVGLSLYETVALLRGLGILHESRA